MKIFFDCEFTGLQKNTTLISIGLIDINNHTFYAEITDYDETQVDEWLKHNVIDRLLLTDSEDPDLIWNSFNPNKNEYLVRDTKENVARHLRTWLKRYDYVELVSDVCHYDMVLFIDLIAGHAFNLPKNVSPYCHDINQDIADYHNILNMNAFDVSREEMLKVNYIKVNGKKHNALYDAKVIKELYELMRCKENDRINIR